MRARSSTLLVRLLGLVVVSTILLLGGLARMRGREQAIGPSEQRQPAVAAVTTARPTAGPQVAVPPRVTRQTSPPNSASGARVTSSVPTSRATNGQAAATTAATVTAQSVERGRAGAEQTARAYAARQRAVPIRDGSFDDTARYCPMDRLRVLWARPASTYRYGAYLLPLGPPPTERTSAVNGVVVCEGSTYALMGFTAAWVPHPGRWQITPVPSGD